MNEKPTMSKKNKSVIKNLRMGALHAEAGRLDSAEASFSKAATEDPTCSEAHFNLAVLFLENGRADHAIEKFLKVISLSPDIFAVHKEFGETIIDYEVPYFDSKTELKNMSALNSAIASYREAIDAIPILRECHRNIGEILMTKGQYSEADTAFAEATKIPGDLQEVFHNVGATIYCPGNLDNAISKHRTVMSRAPDYEGDEISEQSYLETDLTFTDNEILLPDGFEVMMEWERPIMERSAEIITINSGDVLNVGFGMAIIDTAIQAHGVSTHTIIEAHPQVVRRARAWARDKSGINIVAKRWQDAIGDVGPFDGIYFDTLMPPMIPFLLETPNLLKRGGVLTFFQMMVQFENMEAMANTELNFVLERMPFEAVEKNRYYRLLEKDSSGHYSAPLLIYRKI